MQFVVSFRSVWRHISFSKVPHFITPSDTFSARFISFSTGFISFSAGFISFSAGFISFSAGFILGPNYDT